MLRCASIATTGLRCLAVLRRDGDPPLATGDCPRPPAELQERLAAAVPGAVIDVDGLVAVATDPPPPPGHPPPPPGSEPPGPDAHGGPPTPGDRHPDSVRADPAISATGRRVGFLRRRAWAVLRHTSAC